MPALVDAHGTRREKVLVAVPCGDTVHAGFAQDLALLVGWTTHARPDLDVSLAFVTGSLLPRQRAALVQHAVDRTATHIFWLDSDMRFPKDALLRLLAHGKPIVAANYPTRIPPILPTAEQDGPAFDGDGLMAVQHAGLGCCLTALDVFTGTSKPHFAIGYHRDTNTYGGEDVFFCRKMRENGYHIWVDATLSEQVQHLGTFPFTLEHARMTRAAALAEAP